MTESPPSGPSAPEPICPEESPRRGLSFSLRELMLLAVIIALLMVAVTPWYQRRRTLTGIARAQADMRSVAVAIEAYMIDMMAYPACGMAEGFARTVTLTFDGSSHTQQLTIPAGVATIHTSTPPGSGARRSPAFRIVYDSPPWSPVRGAGRALPHTLTTPTA